MEPDLSTLSISSTIKALERRDFSALDLTEACLRQVERLNPVINAFITPTPELAVQSALNADSLLSTGHPQNNPGLLGIPVGVKDLIGTEGIRTTAGSRFFSDNIPAEDAQVVTKLKMGGAVILGKTNTHEIALGVTGVNPHFGTVKNPWDLSRISGGSSSGSAAGVVTGMCLGALGTDTGGSIRIPASFCGVVGLKPTYGRVSARGVLPLSWNLDHVGPLASCVQDAAILLQVLAGYDPGDPSSADVPLDDYLLHLNDGVKGIRIAMAVGEYVENSDPEIVAAIETTMEVYKILGARVEKVDLSWISNLSKVNTCMTLTDAAAFHKERMESHPDWFGEDVRHRLEIGAGVSTSEYTLARRQQTEGRRLFEIFFTKYDLLLLPVTPIPAPSIEGMDAIEAARQLTRFTSPFNLTGLPALSIPCGFTGSGLPLGLQIVSRQWGESQVLQAGHAFEQATSWHLRRPAFIKKAAG